MNKKLKKHGTMHIKLEVKIQMYTEETIMEILCINYLMEDKVKWDGK